MVQVSNLNQQGSFIAIKIKKERQVKQK